MLREVRGQVLPVVRVHLAHGKTRHSTLPSKRFGNIGIRTHHADDPRIAVSPLQRLKDAGRLGIAGRFEHDDIDPILRYAESSSVRFPLDLRLDLTLSEDWPERLLHRGLANRLLSDNPYSKTVHNLLLSMKFSLCQGTILYASLHCSSWHKECGHSAPLFS
jgi:hypothetical protein